MWKREETVNALHIIGISVFCSGLFMGALLTVLWSLTLDNWRIIVGLRLVWVILGGFWAGFSIGKLLEARWRTTIISTLVAGFSGLLISINPLMDFISGPTEIAGKIEYYSEERDTLYRSGNAVQPIISSSMVFTNNDGKSISIDPMGWQTNRIGRALNGCGPGSNVYGAILLHLDSMLHLECSK